MKQLKLGELAIKKRCISPQERDYILKLQKEMRSQGYGEKETLFGQLLIKKDLIAPEELHELLNELCLSGELLGMASSQTNIELHLDIVEGPQKEQRFTFKEYDRVSIGRAKDNFFSFPDDFKVSRYHCLIEILPPCNFFIYDLRSRNGTHLKRSDALGNAQIQKITQAHINQGDMVRVGENIFKIVWDKKIEQEILCDKCGASIQKDQYAKGEASICNDKSLCSRCRDIGEVLVGEQINKFLVLKKLGEGGMGIVYLVQHVTRKYLYAIKFARAKAIVNKKNVAKFLREANLGIKVKHQNIVRHYSIEYMPVINSFYIIMEYIKGITLKDYIIKLGRPLSIPEGQKIIYQLLDAVEHLHFNKIIHRDIKLDNILIVNNEGKVHLKLADFGLAKNFEEAGLSGLTMSNCTLGTLAYMAPEQCYNARYVDPRADIFSTAATIYTMFTGQTIYGNSSKENIYAKIFSYEPQSMRKLLAAIPEELDRIILKCLEKNPDKRIQTIKEMKGLLEGFYKRLPSCSSI